MNTFYWMYLTYLPMIIKFLTVYNNYHGPYSLHNNKMLFYGKITFPAKFQLSSFYKSFKFFPQKVDNIKCEFQNNTSVTINTSKSNNKRKWTPSVIHQQQQYKKKHLNNRPYIFSCCCQGNCDKSKNNKIIAICFFFRCVYKVNIYFSTIFLLSLLKYKQLN